MVFQNYALFSRMTVANHIAYDPKVRVVAMQSRTKTVDRVADLMALDAKLRTKIGSEKRDGLLKTCQPDLRTIPASMVNLIQRQFLHTVRLSSKNTE